MGASSLPHVWGATPTEVAASYPSERHAAPESVRMVRAVDVDASAHDVFLWVCQMRRAPYSYDLLDNFGRRSPRTADPSLTDLEVGDSFVIFTLVDFVPDQSITLVTKPGLPTRLFGALALTYSTHVDESGQRRLVCVIETPPQGRLAPRARRWLLSWGDLVMMRKQLMTFAQLAEAES